MLCYGRHPAGHLELPKPKILQIEFIEAALLIERRPDIDEVIHAVGPVPFEIVGECGLSIFLFLVEKSRQPLAQPGDAFLKILSQFKNHAQVRIDRVLVAFDGGSHFVSEVLDVGEKRLHLFPENFTTDTSSPVETPV